MPSAFPRSTGMILSFELAPEDEEDHRPGQAHEQPVAAGHVGDRQVAGCGSSHPRQVPAMHSSTWALDREVEVDGVLRQHGDQRQDHQRQASRNLGLRDLRCPGEQRRRGEDAKPEDRAPPRRAGCAQFEDVRELQEAEDRRRQRRSAMARRSADSISQLAAGQGDLSSAPSPWPYAGEYIWAGPIARTWFVDTPKRRR